MSTVKPFYPDDSLLKLEFLINGVNQGLDSFLTEGKVHFELNKIPFAKFTFICSEEDFKENQDSPIQSLNRPEGSTAIEIEVKIAFEKEMKTLFKGIIRSLDIEHENCNVVARIECKDIALRLSQTSSEAENNNQTFGERLTTYTNDLQLSDNLLNQSWSEEQITQNNNAVPWDYLIGFLDSIGMLVALRNTEFTGVDIVNPETTATYMAENGINVFAYTGRVDPERRRSIVSIQHWDVENQTVNTVTSEQDATENPHTVRIDQTNLLPETIQRIADTIIAKSKIASISGKVTTFGNLNAKIGEYIGFSKVNPEIDKQTLLISIEEHLISNGCWKTEYTYGLENERSFTENTTTGINNAHAQVGQSNTVNGLLIGIVTQIEEDPNNQFRIKVRIPMLSESGEGVWARLATMNAANEMGSYFIPNVDDEVILGCLGNNPDTPIILGSLYSSSRAMPLPITKDNFIKGFVTKEGTKIIMDDEKKSIELSTKKGNKLTISDDLKGFVIEDENKNKITLDDQGITIESCKDFNVKAKGNIKIEGVQIAQEASAKMNLKGSMINLN
jgi:phage baseplate assembly protein gpV